MKRPDSCCSKYEYDKDFFQPVSCNEQNRKKNLNRDTLVHSLLYCLMFCAEWPKINVNEMKPWHLCQKRQTIEAVKVHSDGLNSHPNFRMLNWTELKQLFLINRFTFWYREVEVSAFGVLQNLLWNKEVNITLLNFLETSRLVTLDGPHCTYLIMIPITIKKRKTNLRNHNIPSRLIPRWTI